MDIEKQLGLGYLDRSSKTETSNRDGSTRSLWNGLDPVEMLSSIGRPLLKGVASAGGVERLYPLLENLHMSISVALPVVEFLEQQDLVEIVDRDLKGNHELRLTKRGRGMIE